jgi:hypothetical protein
MGAIVGYFMGVGGFVTIGCFGAGCSIAFGDGEGFYYF